MLARGIRATLQPVGIAPPELDFSFFGLPAFGEDSRLVAALSAAASPPLPAVRYRCDNDAVCGWAGALGCQDGINIVAGTGSMAMANSTAALHAPAAGVSCSATKARPTGWRVRTGTFSRMSDGRMPRGPLYDLLRRHVGLQSDLDICAHIYGGGTDRSALAALSTLVSQAASAGDAAARALFDMAAIELAQIIDAVHEQLQIPDDVRVTVSYSGGMFQLRDLLLAPLQSALASGRRQYRFAAPRMSAVAGAALYAAHLNGTPLNAGAVAALEARFQST